MNGKNPYRASAAFAGDAYIERDADRQLRAAIQSNTKFIYALAARQSGKSSLIANTMRQLDPKNFRCAWVDLSAAGDADTTSEPAFHKWLVSKCASDLRLDATPSDYADNQETVDILEVAVRAFLEQCEERIIIFFDEVDSLQGLNFKENFFSKIRWFANRRLQEPSLARVQFALFGAMRPGDLIATAGKSPFNIAESIVLRDLTLPEIGELLRPLLCRGVTIDTDVAKSLLELTGGSVYLCQWILEHWWTDAKDPKHSVLTTAHIRTQADRLIAAAIDEIHFQNIRDHVSEHAVTYGFWRNWVSGGKVVPGSVEIERLKIIGICSDTQPFRNQIYRRVFGPDGPMDLVCDNTNLATLGADELNDAVLHYRSLVQDGQWNAAWKFYQKRIDIILDSSGEKGRIAELLVLLFPDGLDKHPRLTSPADCCEVMLAVGDSLFTCGHGEPVDSIFAGAIRCAKQHGSQTLAVRALAYWAFCALYSGRLLMAESLARQAILCSRSPRLPEAETGALRCLGLLSAIRGDPETARIAFDRAMRLRGNDRSFTRYVIGDRAEAMLYLGDIEAATKYGEEARAVVHVPRFNAGLARWVDLVNGLVMQRQGALGEAAHSLSIVVERARSARDTIVEVQGRIGLAEVRLQQEKLEPARVLTEGALNLARSGGYGLYMVDAYNLLSRIELRKGDIKSARVWAEKAYDLACCDGMPYIYRRGLNEAIQTLTSLGRPGSLVLRDADPRKLRDLPHIELNPRREVTITTDWPDGAILELLELTKTRDLDWENTTGSARKWWEAFESENRHRLSLVLRLAEELAIREATITEFFLAYVYSNTDNIQANLYYLDYTRLKKKEERKRREASQSVPQDDSVDSTPVAKVDGHSAVTKPSNDTTNGLGWASIRNGVANLDVYDVDTSTTAEDDGDETTREAGSIGETVQPGQGFAERDLPTGVDNLTGLPEKELIAEIERLKSGLDWENTTGSARKWWKAFESKNRHRLPLVLRLAEELAIRKATITEFFLAYVFSNTDNIQANLYYLDYTLLKKKEERKRREARDHVGDPSPLAPGPKTRKCPLCLESVPVDASVCPRCKERLEIPDTPQAPDHE